MNFFSIPAVSILVSVVICWALFGLACSMIHESVVRIKAERGRFMKAYLLQQLADDANDINWGLELYRQAPVSLLSRDVRKPTDQIDPSVFAPALLSAVAGSNLVQTKLQTLQGQAAAGSAEAGKLLAKLAPFENSTLRQFKAATLLLHPSDQVGLLSSLFADAELKASGSVAAEAEVYQHLLTGIEDWYHGLTDRLSLWYKKVTHRRLFWLGLLIANDLEDASLGDKILFGTDFFLTEQELPERQDYTAFKTTAQKHLMQRVSGLTAWDVIASRNPEAFLHSKYYDGKVI
jgi:hypothetical protein